MLPVVLNVRDAAADMLEGMDENNTMDDNDDVEASDNG